jgi:hypothetical protein
MRPPRVAVWFAVAGALLGVLFFALGHISPEPTDHPRWLMAGSRPVVLAYVVLMGFCLPAFLIDFALLSMVPGWRPGDILSFVTYPLVQGLLYGGVAWAMMSLGRTVLKRLPGRDAPPSITMSGSISGALPGKSRRWRLVGMGAVFVISYSILSLFLILSRLPPSWTADYDRERYAQISNAIKADKQRLLGKSFDEVSKQFGLGGICWDDASFQQAPPTQYRIYHFRGFAFHVTVDLQLPENSPVRQKGSYTFEELQRHGVLRLAHQRPFVRVDGIHDGKERMQRFWKAIDEECERINTRMEQEARNVR